MIHDIASTGPLYAHGCRVSFDNDFPPEIKAAFCPHIHRWAHVIPRQVQEMRFSYDPNEGALLRAFVQPEYRTVDIHVGPKFVNEPLEFREEATLHEIVHIAIAPLPDLFDDVINASDTEKEGPIAKFAREQLRKAMEAVVCDVTAMILAAERQGEARGRSQRL